MTRSAAIAAPPATETIHCLSVHLPDAAFFFHEHPTVGLKTIENRQWRYPTTYRGPLWIHANKWDERPPPDSYWIDIDPPELQLMWDMPEITSIPVGAIIGCVDVVAAGNAEDMQIAGLATEGIKPKQPMTPLQKELARNLPRGESHEWRWWAEDGAIILANPRLLKKPIMGVKGALNIWKYQVDSTKLRLT